VVRRGLANRGGESSCSSRSGGSGVRCLGPSRHFSFSRRSQYSPTLEEFLFDGLDTVQSKQFVLDLYKYSPERGTTSGTDALEISFTNILPSTLFRTLF
jgi:hypothetical protein